MNIRRTRSPGSVGNTDFSFTRNKIIISDWELEKSIADRDDDSDIEWLYEISMKDLDRLNGYLEEKYNTRQLDESILKKNQLEFLRSCRKTDIKRLFLYLVKYMKTGNGADFVREIEEQGIPVEQYSL
jgi:hypothetical protein